MFFKRERPIRFTVLALLCVQFFNGLSAAEPIRDVVQINDRWLFQYADSESIALNPGAWESIAIPHAWNIADGSQTIRPYRRGVGYYQRSIGIPDAWRGRSTFLTFGAANAKAVISWNGDTIGEHRTGFTAFTVDVTRHLRAEAMQDLQITVDNRHHVEFPPLISDYTYFGGLYRSVWLTVTDPVHISLTDHSSSGVYLVQQQVNQERAEVDAQVVVANDLTAVVTDATVSVEVMTPDGTIITTVKSEPLTLAAKASAKCNLPVTIERPHLWDGRQDPFCYRARVRIHRGDRITDEVVQPLGLRFFSVDPNRGFLLNGRPYDLHGVALHQGHAGKGWAISDEDRAVDVGLVTEIGATCVRLLHYPHASATLDLLDKAGIVVWSEIPIAFRLGKLSKFEDNSRMLLTEMICQLYNHPSVCFWGLSYDLSGARPEALQLAQHLNEQAKALDPVRLTVGATGAMNQDPICEVTDVIAFKRYLSESMPEVGMFSLWAESHHKMFPDRCIGIAEYGAEGVTTQHADHRAARAIERFDMNAVKRSEEYQTQLHEEMWLQLANKPYLWCKMSMRLADWAVSIPTPTLPSPMRWSRDDMGMMGMVSNDRQIKKDAFYWYKANWTTDPMLHIAERRFTPRQFREFDLRVYSNLRCAMVVTINGKPITIEPEIQGARYLWPNLQAPPGKWTVTVIANTKDKELTDSVIWEFPDILPPKSALRPEETLPKPDDNSDF